MNAAGQQYPARIDRIFFFSLIIVSTAWSALQVQDNSGIELKTAQLRVQLKQPSVVSMSIVVRNVSGQLHHYRAAVTLPEGWRPVTQESPFVLNAGDMDIRLLNFSVPSKASAGRYIVHYTVQDDAAPQQSASLDLEINLLSVLQFELALLDAPRFVVSGKSYQALFAVTNKGNTTGTLRLALRNSNNFSASLDSEQVTIRAQETKTVVAKVQTEQSVLEKITNTCELSAPAPEDSLTILRATAIVDVIPQVQRTENANHELPLQVRFRSTGDRLGSRQQLELLGAGIVSERRRDRLEFLFRSPETQQSSILGLRDEYRLHYESATLDLQVGDWNYALSPLTEQSRFATGITARIHSDGVLVGGFYNQTRESFPKQKEMGGFFSYEISPNADVGINYLKKQQSTESDVITGRGIFHPWRASTLEAEVGRSTGSSTSDNAISLHVNGKESWLAYDLRYIDAGPRYAGYYKNVSLQSVNLNFLPWQHVRFEMYYRDEKRNLQQDTLQFYAPRDRSQQIGIGYSNFVSVYYRSNVQQDELPIPKYSRLENTTQVHVGYGSPTVSVFANADLGFSEDKMLGKKAPFSRYSLYFSAVPKTNQNYTLSLEHSADHNLFSDEDQVRYSATLTAWLLLGQATQVQVNLFGSRFLSSFTQSNAFVDFIIDHVFPFNHRIVFKGRQNYFTPAIDSPDRAYSIEYGIPVGVPLYRISSIGQLRGRVMDDQGKGVSDVLVNIGNAVAVTDASGGYFFPALPPGKQFLIVDRSTVGLERVTLQPMPLEIDIRGGEETRVDIGVVKSGRITGTVSLFNFSEESTDSTQSRTVAAGGLAGVVLELSSGAEVQRRLTDVQGKFIFADLRPGTWKLSIAGGEIPQGHSVEKESVDLNVQQEGQDTVLFNIVPRQRTIRIIQEGTVVQQGARPHSQPPRVEMPRHPASPCLVSRDSRRNGYVLQISSWATRGKAMQEARAAEKNFGYTAIVEQVDTPELGARYHVVLGMFKTRQEAEDLCHKVQQAEVQ